MLFHRRSHNHVLHAGNSHNSIQRLVDIWCAPETAVVPPWLSDYCLLRVVVNSIDRGVFPPKTSSGYFYFLKEYNSSQIPPYCVLISRSRHEFDIQGGFAWHPEATAKVRQKHHFA